MIELLLDREDAARLLLDLHRRRAEHVACFRRQGCWQDRVIAALERSLGTVEGPPRESEARWVCASCHTVNVGLVYCRTCLGRRA